MTPNQKAFLDCIAWSEGTSRIPNSDDGYLVLVGATPENPILFKSYDTHPGIYNKALDSTAAGRYQINKPTWSWYMAANQKAVRNFTPETQDAIALWLIDRHGATQDVIDGNFTTALAKCDTVWASLPTSTYGQHTNTFDEVAQAYMGAGGMIAS